MSNDETQEFDAMRAVTETLQALDEGARARVLTWINQRFTHAAAYKAPETNATMDSSQPQDFAELYGAADPRSEEEQALIAAYWKSKANGILDMDAQAINTLLKDLGYPVSNITRSLGRLQARRPTLVRQVQKAGRTKQARKKYRLTAEGARAVEEILRGRHLALQE